MVSIESESGSESISIFILELLPILFWVCSLTLFCWIVQVKLELAVVFVCRCLESWVFNAKYMLSCLRMAGLSS